MPEMNDCPISIRSVPPVLYSARLIPGWLPGRTRLTRSLFKALAKRGRHKGSCYRIEAESLSYFAPSLLEPVATSLVLDACYEPSLRKAMEEFLPMGGVFVDVGANIGCHSFWASKLVGGAGRVLSIEASPYIFECLQRGISTNHISNIQAFNLVAGERVNTACRFYDSPRDKFGMGSRSSEMFGSDDKSFVPMVKLDSLLDKGKLKRVDIIKIDVEGYEKMVIEGSRSLIENHHPLIVFEFADWSESRPSEGISPGDTQRLLIEMGYDIYDIKTYHQGSAPLSSARTSGSADLLAVWQPSS